MDEKQTIIDAYRKYGILIESDSSGLWYWATIGQNGITGEEGLYSPYFSTFVECISDLEDSFGKLEA